MAPLLQMSCAWAVKDFNGGPPNLLERRAVSHVAVAMASPLFRGGSESTTTLGGTGEVRAELSKTCKRSFTRPEGVVAVVTVFVGLRDDWATPGQGLL